MMAYGAYAQAQSPTLVVQMGEKDGLLWYDVAQAFIAQKNYLRALGYLKKAQQPYANLASDSYLSQVALQQALEPVQTTFMETVFKNGTDNLIRYYKAYSPQAVSDMQMKSLLVDALMFYLAITDTADPLYYDQSQRTMWLNAGKERVATYLASQPQTATSVGSLFSLPPEQIETFITKAYAAFAAPLADGKRDPEEHDKAVGTIVAWAQDLFSALSAVYIQQYLPDEKYLDDPQMHVDQFNDLMNAIKFANNDLLFPPEQVIGAWEGTSTAEKS
jgi:hypothetical protein